jgi:hypothetical protein
MNKILILITFCLFATTSFAKDKLTILNAGSKTGSFAMQMTAVSKDLQKNYDIDLKIPGDYCTAVQMLKSIKGPVLMPWANDFEAIGRDGSGCATFEVKPSQVVRYDNTVMHICSINHDAASLMTSNHTVGHTGPAKSFSRAILALNESFGAKLKPIAYDGSGATKAGLYNGEVDYALISIKHGRDIIKNGGQCYYEYSANEKSNLIPLAVLDPSNKFLIAGYDAVWLALNMDEKAITTLKAQVKEIHNDPSSAMYQYTQGGKVLNVIWDLSNSEITEKWEISVKNLQESN